MLFVRSTLPARSRPLFSFFTHREQLKLYASSPASRSVAISHTYPGINFPLRYRSQGKDSMYPIGADDSFFAGSTLLPVREVFMMALMESLTNKVDWHKKVLNERIVANWRKEALAQPEDKLYLTMMENKTAEKLPMPHARILSEAAFDYCIKELRQKASHFEKTGLIPTLDSAGFAVVKSDSLVTSELRQDLKQAFDKLCVDQAANVDWHPRSNEMVQNLVHPSMYPFVFGRSNFFQEEVVGVSDAVESWAGKGETVGSAQKFDKTVVGKYSYPRGSEYFPPRYWSNKYQWLPSNLSFRKDGTVKFTSYINNLHPNRYPEIYRTIEKLIDTALPAWDQCLLKYHKHDRVGFGRQKSRFSQPTDCPPEEEDDHLWEPLNVEVLAQHDIKLSPDDLEYIEAVSMGNRSIEEEIQRYKWRSIRQPIFPEPDNTKKVKYLSRDKLRKTFKASGLQIIVKMATIELTPSKPEFPMGGWHIEGQMNERICATALYYLDSDNVTPSHLSFRTQTSPYQEDLQAIASQDNYNWLERFYGTALGPSAGATNACLQYYGSTETREGRLLAFPNTFQHRVSSFKLQDPTRPGHRRFIALWLVDPHRRIVSTANVPPQQLDWWTETTSPSSLNHQHDNNGSHVPKKDSDVPKGLMSLEEAKQHRAELIDIRSGFHQTSSQDWESEEYSFCEH